MGTQRKFWTAWTAVGLLALTACAEGEETEENPEDAAQQEAPQDGAVQNAGQGAEQESSEQEASEDQRAYTFGANEAESTEGGDPVYIFTFEAEGGETLEDAHVVHTLPEGLEPRSTEPEGEEDEDSLTQSWTTDISAEEPLQVEREAVLVSPEAAVQDTDPDEVVDAGQGEEDEFFESTFCLYEEAGGEEIDCVTLQVNVEED